MLEIVSALRLPQRVTGHWALAAAGSWFHLPRGAHPEPAPCGRAQSRVSTVGVYALIFGALVSTAAILIRHRGLHVGAPSMILRDPS
jgi:hypothetical protein